MTMKHPGSSTRSLLASLGVHASIILAVALFLGSISLLYYRSLTLVEPSSMVDVRGDDSLAGAEVSISGPALDEPLQTLFDRDNDYQSRFFLDRGSYLLTVRRQGHTLFNQHFFVRERTHLSLAIPPSPASGVQPRTGRENPGASAQNHP